jgi:UDP-2,4-diacetamido-2,4,6-trideoxy-beta-L-altropyranose hydrolase
MAVMLNSPLHIVFRTDASALIGMGHVMRCLTLAHALKNRGALCQFICRAHIGHAYELITSHGFECTLLPLVQTANVGSSAGKYASWLGSSWNHDAQETKQVLADKSVDWLILDHYAIDQLWENELRGNVRKIMVIDDLVDRVHDCDVLLNQNLLEPRDEFYRTLIPTSALRLLGPEFALLQPDYQSWRSRVLPRSGSVRRVVVYFGGADSNNMTGRIIDAFIALRRHDITVDVIASHHHPFSSALDTKIAGYPNIIRHQHLTSLAPLFSRADFAIGAGGATSWERCCLGLPSLIITIADNQIPIANAQHKYGYSVYLGREDELSNTALQHALNTYLTKPLENDWSTKISTLVDGAGAERVASFLLLEHVEQRATHLPVRLATTRDIPYLARWENRDEPASLAHYLLHPEQFTLAIVCTDQQVPIAYARLIQHEDAQELSISYRPGLATHVCAEKINLMLLEFLHQHNHNSQPFFIRQSTTDKSYTIAICADEKSWINVSVPQLIWSLLQSGHRVAWTHQAQLLRGGDFCFLLSYSRIVSSEIRQRFCHTLVVHASDLPRGRGWSPTSWLILAGETRVPVTLIEAQDPVDSGPIYAQQWISLNGSELADEWRGYLAQATADLAHYFIANYPGIVQGKKAQQGEPTSYPRRRPSDSELNPQLSLSEQFNLLRIVDNEHYPAFFRLHGHEFVVHITKRPGK